MVHPAAIYNEKRRILFSTYYKRNLGPSAAFEYLEKYKQTLTDAHYIGLKAELEFFDKYKSDFKLCVAADVGDHTDFSGIDSSGSMRIDVTTCMDMKSLSDYEPFIKEGEKYKIAIIDKTNWELSSLVDISFPSCIECGDSFLFKVGVMMGENYNRHGESQWSYDQKLLNVCPSCYYHEIIETITTPFMPQVSEFVKELPEEMSTDEKCEKIKEYKSDVFKYLKKSFDPHLMGFAEYDYQIYDRDGDGSWGLDFLFVNKFVDNYLDDFIEIGEI